jgi:hypothetical protein
MEYPKYVSHKEVSAAKITEVDPGADGSLTLHLEGGFDNVVILHHERKNKPQPAPGWYLVRYADGYVSFSPAKQFEEGYTLIVPNGDAAGEPGDGSGEQLSAGSTEPGPALGLAQPPVNDEDDDEDEEVRDAANNHGQPQPVGVAD